MRARRSPTASAVAPPMPLSTSSNTRHGVEPFWASTTLSASISRASSPPEATRASGPGSWPGLVAISKAIRSAPSPDQSASVSGIRRTTKRALSSLSGGNSAITALASSPAARRAGGGKALCGGREGGSGSGGRGARRSEALAAGVDAGDARRDLGLQRGEAVDRHAVLAGRRAQREQALLDGLEAVALELELLAGALEQRGALLELDPGALERGRRRLERLARRDPLERPLRGQQPCRGTIRRGERGQRIVERLAQLLAAHQPRARGGERLLLAGLRRQRRELVPDVAPIGFLGRGTLEVGRERAARLLGRAPYLPGGAHRGDQRREREAAMMVKQRALQRRLEQRLLLVLAVDLDQQLAEPAQQAAADRLVVDEGARAAVGRDQAAQHQLVLGGDAVLGEQALHAAVAEVGERRGDRALRRTLAHQRAVGAPAEREPHGIEQDRLAGAGLAGQHAEAFGELEVEPLDQDDVADHEAGQHGAGRRVRAACISRCASARPRSRLPRRR